MRTQNSDQTITNPTALNQAEQPEINRSTSKNYLGRVFTSVKNGINNTGERLEGIFTRPQVKKETAPSTKPIKANNSHERYEQLQKKWGGVLEQVKTGVRIDEEGTYDQKRLRKNEERFIKNLETKIDGLRREIKDTRTDQKTLSDLKQAKKELKEQLSECKEMFKLGHFVDSTAYSLLSYVYPKL